MMYGKDLKDLLKGIPDEAIVTIDDNYKVDIVGYDMSTALCPGDCHHVNLNLTEGFSITKDSIIDEMFNCMGIK